MGFKMPIVCKKLILPIQSDDNLTLEEYKEKYGVDLRKYISFDNGYINLTFPNNADVKISVVGQVVEPCAISSINVYDPSAPHDAGATDGETYVALASIDSDGALNSAYGFKLMIDKDDALSVDNVKIVFFKY